MTEPATPCRRRPFNAETRRTAAARASFRHLRDLTREHGKPPPDVPLPTLSAPPFVPGILEYSWCGSPAAMCAELGESRLPPSEGAPSNLPLVQSSRAPRVSKALP